MSDSVRPHRWQPTRLPRPWDSPGKNTGVGCHCLLHTKTYRNSNQNYNEGITSLRSEWPLAKSLQTINAGEGVGKREPSAWRNRVEVPQTSEKTMKSLHCLTPCRKTYTKSIRDLNGGMDTIKLLRKIYRTCLDINRSQFFLDSFLE